jgi:site-specific recombinase XerD
MLVDLNNMTSNEVEQLRGLLFPTSGSGEAFVTLGRFVEEYLGFIKLNRSESYYKNHNLSFGHLVEHFKEQRMLSMISFRDAELFMTQLQHKVSKGYRVYYRNLKAAFNKAVEWQYILENPFLKVKLPKQQKNQPAYLSEEELKTILDKIELKVVRDVSAFSFYTGCRLGEAVNLRWRNVNLDEGFVVIGDDEFVTKGRNQRTIPLCEGAGKAIRHGGQVVNAEKAKDKAEKETPSLILPLEKREIEGYVFAKGNGMPFSGDYISKKFKSGCRLAGVSEKIHFHSLRHSFASNLAERDVSIYKIKELMGHSSITTTEIYAHLNLDGLRSAVRVLDGPNGIEKKKHSMGQGEENVN